MKIAAAAYRPRWWSGDALTVRLRACVAEAAAKGADLLLFPEYAGCEAALDLDRAAPTSARGWAGAMAECADGWAKQHSALAEEFGVWIIAGSLCATNGDGLVNRAYICGPHGQVAWQDKMILTPYERDDMGVGPGQALRLFETPLGKIGILICYDSEFPLLARALVAAGADMILVPSATDYPAGQTRVRQSCRARAIEGQCLVVQATVLGGLSDCEILDCGTGRAGFFCPPDYGLPADGILAQGETDQEGWVIAEVDPAAIAAPRHSGQVGNFAHWDEQDDRLNSVTVTPLR